MSDGFSESRAAGLDESGATAGALETNSAFETAVPDSGLTGAATETDLVGALTAGTGDEDCFVSGLGGKPLWSPRIAYALFFAAVRDELKS